MAKETPSKTSAAPLKTATSGTPSKATPSKTASASPKKGK